MQLIHFREESPQEAPTVVTIGNFDGVHLGHQALIREVVEDARQLGGRSVLLTFNPHPQSVLKAHRVPILTNLAQRMRLFEQLGVDTVCLIPFTPELAQMSAEDFVREYIVGRFHPKRVVIGYDFAFGRNRQGTAEVLEAASGTAGFSFRIFPAVTSEDEIVSSTRIRAALAAGEFASAERLLLRPYSVLGPVTEGQRNGRKLGFPTLNLVPEDPLPLGYGVYASRTALGERLLDGVTNYGVRPTIGTDVPTFETHLFDFDEDLYGHTVEIIPIAKLRDERKFGSLAELQTQIAKDSKQARELLEGLRA